MRKDVVNDRYARLYELPVKLFEQGVEVRCVSLSYRSASRGQVLDVSGLPAWFSFNVTAAGLPNLRDWVGWYRAIVEFRPDVIIGASDALHIIAAHGLSARLGVPFGVDLYDNFASFGMTQLPGVNQFYRRALAHAAFVSCVSEPLKSLLVDKYAVGGELLTLESTINIEDFPHIDRALARHELGLPQDLRLVGTAGALNRSNGISTLYDAFEQLQGHPDVTNLGLLLAGRNDAESPLPSGARVIYLGELSHEKMRLFWAALDVAVVCVRDTEFGRYSFPQKIYEILASGTPVVAAKVGAMSALLEEFPDALYQVDNTDSLRDRLLANLANQVAPQVPIPSWQQQAVKLKEVMQRVISCKGNKVDE